MKLTVTFLLAILCNHGFSQSSPPVEIVTKQIVSGKYVFVNKSTGKAVNHDEWDNITPFVNGYAIVSGKGKYGIADRNGIVINKQVYDSIRNFNLGRAAVMRNGKWGFIDTSGAEKVKPIYDAVANFVEKVTTVYINGDRELIDREGTLIRTIGSIQPTDGGYLQQYRAQEPARSLQANKTLTIACPPNIDFEYGNFTNWQCHIGTVTSPGTSNIISVTPTTPINDRHTMLTRSNNPSGLDYYGAFPVNPPNGSGHSVKIGNDHVGAQAERIRYQIQVPMSATDYSITFQYAVVLENPDAASTGVPHDDWEQPRFTAKMYDPITGTYLPCASFTYVASLVPGFYNSLIQGGIHSNPAGARIKYKPWSSVYVNLSKYAGQTLYLDFTTADCSLSGHFGYAYVDVVECGVAASADYSCVAPNVTTLHGPPGFQTYKWFNSSFSAQLGTAEDLVLNPGPPLGSQYWVVVKPYNNTDCATCDCTDTLKVTVSANYPDADAGADQPVCYGKSVSLGSSATQGYTYQWSPAAGLSNPSSSSPTASPTINTRYILTVTDNKGCAAQDSTEITVNPKPTAAFTINQTTQCLGGNLFSFINNSSFNSGNLGYGWDFGDGGNSAASAPSHSYNTSGIYTITLTATAPNGCQDVTTQQVNVLPPPSPAFTINNDHQCLRGNLFVFGATGTGISNYSWDIAGFIHSVQQTPQYSFSQPGNYFIKLVATGGNGCKDSSTVQVFVHPQPIADFSINNNMQCLGVNSFNFINNSSVSSGNINYNWNFGHNTGSSSATNPSYSYPAHGSYIVRLIASTNPGCIDSIKKTVTVYPNPVVNYSINNNSQCLPGNNFVFMNQSSVNPGSVFFTWHFGDGNISTQTNPSHSYSVAGTFQAQLVVTTNNGCKDSLATPINVYAIPQVSIAPANAGFCESDSAIITATATAGSGNIINYEWYRNGVLLTGTSSNQLVVFQGGSYDVVVTNSNGCVRRSSTSNIIMHPLPAGNMLPPLSYIICEGSGITLTAAGGYVYQWLLNGAPISGAVSNTYYAIAPGTYSVELITQYGCKLLAQNTAVLTYIAKPLADFIFTDYCVNVPVNFNNRSTITNSGPVTWRWTFGDASGSAIFNPQHTYTVAGTYTVQLKATSNVCMQLIDSIAKDIVIETPPANRRYPTVNAVINSPQQLQARDSGTAYIWRPSTGLNNSLIKNPVYNYNKQQEYTIRIRTISGCLVTDTVLVQIFKEGDIFVPRAWSPNYDGHNDYLYPILVGMMELKVFRIFNRWGQLMFETTEPRKGWNGIFNKNPQPNDTYTWTVEAVDPDGKTVRRSGNSVLMR